MDELIDVYDADLRPQGVMDRRRAHMDGRWHRTIHCWVYTTHPEVRVLFQRRAPRMKNFPGLLDVSAAGHLASGESMEDGIREAREELGIPVDFSDLTYAGERVEVGDYQNGRRNREYQSVYFSEQEADLAAYSPDPDEVWGLYWLRLEDMLGLFSGEAASVPSSGIEYSEAEAEFTPHEIQVAVTDFVPRIQRYYLAGAICVERLSQGNRVIAIS